MKRIALTLAGILAAALATAAPAAANYGTRICYAHPADPALIHYPAAIEEGDSTAFLAGMIVRHLPDSPVGCAGHNGVPLDPSYETLWPGDAGPFVPPASAPPVVEQPAAPAVTSSTTAAAPAPSRVHRCGKAHRKHRHYARNCGRR